jgi:hypothetical protein
MSAIGVVYICRYPDPNFEARLTRFVRSWQEHPPGTAHKLYVIYKEFPGSETLEWAVNTVQPLEPIHILSYNDFNSYGGGCFQEACGHLLEPLLCTLVSTTEIMHTNWLRSLWYAYDEHKAGLVGCTGSKEGNLHIRDTAIIIDRDFYVGVSKQFDFTTSKDGYLDFEHGPNNLTIQVMRAKMPVFVVEKDRIIEPKDWGHTTYRGNMSNVLVHDRGSRDFQDL